MQVGQDRGPGESAMHGLPPSVQLPHAVFVAIASVQLPHAVFVSRSYVAIVASLHVVRQHILAVEVEVMLLGSTLLRGWQSGN